MSEEFYWWTWSKISGDHRLSCSPSASTSTACRFAFKLCIEFEERLLYKKNEFDPEKIIFLWKTYKKIIVSKPIKHNKNVDTLLFLLSVTKCQREKKILKEHYLWVQAHKKGENHRVLGLLLDNIYQIQKTNF